MFSTTTMASSTTNPTAMVSAISDRLSRLNPARYITAQEPSSASGTVTVGISVTQKLRMNNKITSTTSMKVSASVNSTSTTEARIVMVRSRMVSTLMDGGMVAVRAGNRALMESTVSMTLAPGCLLWDRDLVAAGLKQHPRIDELAGPEPLVGIGKQ